MMATGYGTALLFGMVALINYSQAESIDDRDNWSDDDWGYDSGDDWNGDGLIDGRDERNARSAARTTVGIAAVGLALGVGGTVFLAKRIAKRRVYSPEIRELRERRRRLLYGLHYGANLGPGQMRLSLGGSF